MTCSTVIAIDGTAGSGKSTLGLRLAERLGYLFFDTGVLYRAVAWAVLARGVAVDEREAVEAVARTVRIVVAPPGPDERDGRTTTVAVDGVDVTWAIRAPDVEQCVSRVSAYPGVRAALHAEQRAIGERGRVVMVGRDIGTVIMPDAGLKLFVDAAVEERARRRCADFTQRGIAIVYAELLDEMRRRDTLDREKPISPMVPAPDAVYVDTTTRPVEDLVAWISQQLVIPA